jgi:hypothetical protein
MSRRSSGVRSTFAAPRFSSRRCSLDGVAEIRVIELRIFVDLACQKTLTKRSKWNESDPEFFKRRQHHFFRLPPPERVLALKCGDRLNRVCAADRLRSCFYPAFIRL